MSVDLTIKIGKYLTLADACKSNIAIRNGIDNTPGEKEIAALKAWAENIYDPICDHFGCKIPAESVFRCQAVNALAKGSFTSQHPKGEAGDLDADGMSAPEVTNKAIFDFVLNSGKVDFDQLIWEYGTDQGPAWVHISYSLKGNRKQALRCVKERGRSIYRPYKQTESIKEAL